MSEPCINDVLNDSTCRSDSPPEMTCNLATAISTNQRKAQPVSLDSLDSSNLSLSVWRKMFRLRHGRAFAPHFHWTVHNSSALHVTKVLADRCCKPHGYLVPVPRPSSFIQSSFKCICVRCFLAKGEFKIALHSCSENTSRCNSFFLYAKAIV